MDAILLLFLSVAICVCAYYTKEKRKNVNNFPSPPGHFIFGHILEISSATKSLSVCTRFLNSYGTILKLKVGFYYTILLTSDYKFIEFILSKNKGLLKSENYYFLKPWLGSGLLIAEGDEWKRSRKMLSPAFHFGILKNFIGVFESVGDIFVDKIKDIQDLSNIDMSPLISLGTLDAICETIMETKINAQKGENSEYVRNVTEMGRIMIGRSFSLLKLKNWSFVFTLDYWMQRKIVKILHKFTVGVITERKTKVNSEDFVNKSKKLSFLDLLQNYRTSNGQLLSEDKIRQEVDTFMFAGHDTSGSSICFTLYCLANNPDIQDRILSEQRELFGDTKDPKVTYEDLQNMKYLENVIKESLRLYPPVPVIGRYTTEDLHFENHIIAKNTNLVLFIYALHRNPEFFPDPEKFDPDRFSTLDGSLPYAYMPFSAGDRNCIGQKFAMLEMKSLLSKIVRHFELKSAVPKHELELSIEMVLKSVNGVKIGLTLRN